MEAISCGRIPCSALMQGGESWPCLNLECQTLLTAQERPYHSEEGVGSGGVRKGEEREGGGTLVSIQNEKYFNKLKRQKNQRILSTYLLSVFHK